MNNPKDLEVGKEIARKRINQTKKQCEGHWLGENSIGSWFTAIKRAIAIDVEEALTQARQDERKLAEGLVKRLNEITDATKCYCDIDQDPKTYNCVKHKVIYAIKDYTEGK